MDKETTRLPIESRLTTLILRHESTSCKAEKELIVRCLKEERRTLLTCSTNLAMEKDHTKSGQFYRQYKNTCKALRTLTGNEIYDRF